jgi:hypothetical protein
MTFMETIDVTARFDARGQIRPIKFIWNGTTYQVESTGRTWTAKDGVHILVMVPDNRTFHLLFSPNQGIWRLIRRDDTPTITVA